MSFTPHTSADIQSMLETLKVSSIDDLFDEIPQNLRFDRTLDVPEGMNEIELNHLTKERAAQTHSPLSFLGAGAYEHHIPAAVWDLTSRGEFLTAYTPYQAEASQGTLQLLYEFQSMICGITGMEVANASMYDGASALAESVLMAARLHKGKEKRVLLANPLHPHYLETVESIVKHQGIEIIYAKDDNPITAVIIQNPTFFGSIDDVDALTHWAHEQGALVIAVVNPISLGLLKEPGSWGQSAETLGADITCGEGQSLGIPLASGGPYFGFMACRMSHVRQMPGRIIGKTVDEAGKVGYALTLQAREQHIRRSKATSNICTNQGLMTTAATIYMSLIGPQGLEKIAQHCYQKAHVLKDKLTQIPGVSLHAFSTPHFFHEFVIDLPTSTSLVLEQLLHLNIIGGLDLTPFDMPESLLICVTETKTDAELTHYANALQQVLQELAVTE